MKKNKVLKGAVICYLDVANLSPDKADQFVLKTTKKMKKFIKKIKRQGYDYLTVPVRGQSTQLVYLPLSA